MRAISPLVTRSLRRNAGTSIVTTLLIAIAAALMHTALVLAIDYTKSLPEARERTNSADVFMVTVGDEASRIATDAMDADDRATLVETSPALLGTGEFDTPSGTLSAGMIVTALEPDRELSRTTIVEEYGQTVDHPIFVPQLLVWSGVCELGGPIDLVLNGTTYSFSVQGTLENPWTANFMTGLLGFELPQAEFDSLFGDPGLFLPSTLIQASTPTDADADLLGADVASTVTETLGASSSILVPYWSSARFIEPAFTITSSLTWALSLFFAVIVLIVTIVVVQFTIRAALTRDLEALGTQKALGYTDRQIGAAFTTQAAIPAIVGSIIGILLSFPMLSALEDLMGEQSGLRWQAPARAEFIAAVAIFLILAVAATASLSARRVRRLTPVAALRGGQSAHGGSPASPALASTRGGVNTLVGLQTLTKNTGKSLLVSLVLALTSFLVVFSAGAYENFISRPENFSRSIIGIAADIVGWLDDDADRDAAMDQVRALPEVESAYFMDTIGIDIDGVGSVFHVADDFTLIEDASLFEGRVPIHANEVVLGGRLASDRGLEVGDSIRLDITGEPADFLVTGLYQSVRNMGNGLYITAEGMRVLSPEYEVRTINVQLADDVSPEQGLTAVRDGVSEPFSTVTKFKEAMDSVTSGYTQLVAALALGIAVVAVGVILLVIGLMVTSSLLDRRKEFGVMKALGFTHRDVTVQMLWGYLPAVAVGAVLGVGIGVATVSPMVASLLVSAGVMHMDFQTSPLVSGLLAVGLVVVAGLFIVLLTGRTRRLNVRELVTD